MTDRTQFGQAHFGCEACEAMCLDAVDGTLTPAEQAVFDRHVAGCVECAEQYAEAKRGAAWMEMLKGHRPEPSPALLQRILAQTSEAQAPLVVPVGHVVAGQVVEAAPGAAGGWWGRVVSAFSFDATRAHFQPRLAMTAAMAFFSIALTLNLSGVRLSDLRPGSIQRSVADARASVARTVQNMRVVYQVESRVNELWNNDERDPGGPFGDANDGTRQQPAAAPKAMPQDEQPKKDKQPVPEGTSELIMPGARLERVSSSKSSEQTAPGADAPRVQKGA